MSFAEGRAPARSVCIAMLAVFVLRLLHMKFAIAGPLTWQLGPDEDYYRQFGEDVAFGSLGMIERFAFMDPLYGYIVGAVLKLSGSLFPLYLLQILVDCASAYGLYRIACELRMPRAGLVAIAVYAVTGTAIAYTMAVLKATWVACYVVYWIYASLVLLRRPQWWRCACFGALCGLGVALRANLLLLVPLGMVALSWLWWRQGNRDSRLLITRNVALLAGLCLPLLLLAARNHAISGQLSPMPNNGGVVLHQLYNPENPESRAGAPSFVRRYSVPDEIWLGYKREAERRAGHPLAAHEVNAYWGKLARDYLIEHPGQDMRNAVRKLREISAYPEVPNTRNYSDERIVSPLLRWLPLPFGWLFALGIPGLCWMLWRDRRTVLVVAPLAMGVATMMVFFAEDRFRFNVTAPLILGTAVWLDAITQAARNQRWQWVGTAAAASLLLGVWTISQARLIPVYPSDWQRLAWGYLKSGQRENAEQTLRAASEREPGASGISEIRGYLAMGDREYAAAAKYFKYTLSRRGDRHEIWHNYSLALEGVGQLDQALQAEQRAYGLVPDPDYRERIQSLLRAGAHVAP